MVKQIKCDDPRLKDQVQDLLNFHLGSIGELAGELEMSVGYAEERGDEPLYLCRVVVTDPRSGRLAVEERQADITLTVNRALARIVRSLMRRQQNLHSI
ncbi:MAG: hypothetical protein KUF77_02325 [Candidatus Thiodiazotropha sp. (ex Lucina aurantia)]|nr:hypothetical protein [Candidatus Thiodiazotropha sp. (ex Lucina pensylvanica)]MBT3022555.1 hypothetical protein [Candidatus Thiodiazotropha taylori]MBT3053161.1 hypothetical protein [Candidatus Thiodiazotropha sp. (ex Codakia orbicularis)]MBV2101848.1 hypothetical protein [Candidatus Thiodiazotropha sp. (ex Lucina aurantia)]MBT3033246.1 hypothetical protein [Candidatus Thiodiazotropha sp. (ex Lucina pensylvanica)]